MVAKGVDFLTEAAKAVKDEVKTPHVSLRQLLLYLDVAENEGISQAELREKHDLTVASATREMKALGKDHYDLLDTTIRHPTRINSAAVRLTAKGRELIQKIKGLWEE